MFLSFCLITAGDYCEASGVAWPFNGMADFFGGNFDFLKDLYVVFQPRFQSLLLKFKLQLCLFLPCKIP